MEHNAKSGFLSHSAPHSCFHMSHMKTKERVEVPLFPLSVMVETHIRPGHRWIDASGSEPVFLRISLIYTTRESLLPANLLLALILGMRVCMLTCFVARLCLAGITTGTIKS